MKLLRLWTDGTCCPEPGGIGGWAFIAETNGDVLHRASGAEPDSSANRMELKAAIEALMWDGHGFHSVEILSDSLHVVRGASVKLSGWTRKDFRRGRKGKGEPIFSADLWRELDALLRRPSFMPTVKWSWVRGHSMHEFNIEADQLAQEARRRYRRDQHAHPIPAPSHLQLARSDRR